MLREMRDEDHNWKAQRSFAAEQHSAKARHSDSYFNDPAVPHKCSNILVLFKTLIVLVDQYPVSYVYHSTRASPKTRPVVS